MKKSLFTLSMVALATNQAIAAIPTSYKLVPVDTQPVAPYQLTALGLTESGVVTGVLTSRITETDTTNDIYSDLFGVYDDETVTDLVDDYTNSTSGSYRTLTSGNGFVADPSVSLVPGLASSDDLLTVTSDVTGGIDNFYFGYNTAPWQLVTYKDSSDNDVSVYQRNYDNRGFFTDNNGTSYPLYPLFTYPEITRGDTTVVTANEKLGGISVAENASSSYIVGYSSSKFSTGSSTALDNCSESDEVLPILVCMRNSGYQYRATVWPLTNGVPGNPISLGILGERTGDDDNPAAYNSYGYAINDNGIVAGQSTYLDGDTNRQVATIFDVSTGKPIKAITKTNSDISSSIAYGINNNNLVVGQTSYPASYSTYRFFIYNYDTDTITYPSTFYESANSTAYDVNNSDLVVGAADYEQLPPSSARRQHAFVYDADNGVFADINTRLQFDSSTLTQVYDGDTCAAREDWVLEGAQKINDAGQIAATAVTTLRDSSGNQVLDDDGNVQYVLRPVLLEPSDETATTCVDDQDESYSRSGGGSFGVFGLGVLGLLGLRRRKH
ncbi:MAG: DUF3466 family protein [Pseudomonadota bacterium]|uniref:DUF3466 family protein n=1 Tax=Gallaecimonas pentaromativorans TaxID=584787 RepID=UPI00067F272F|nr:DUF3466 family protein [Gallaecimonas pentaromativorans]MED5525411.1 DUF3466 family protein [Pseudomonadota bacterium]